MTQKITLLIPAFLKVVAIKYSEIQNPKSWIILLSQKAKVTASYFDSHKTNFTEIVLIPIESKQLNTPFYQSVRKNY